MKRAIFLDRDGVIIVDKHYLKDWREVEFIPGAIDAMQKAHEAGYLLVVVTNQSGIGRGLLTEADYLMCDSRMRNVLATHDVLLADTYFAPEAPDQPSLGRKPSPYFVLQAAEKHQIDLDNSYGIGDRLTDLQCWKNAGLKESILVMTGKGKSSLCECTQALSDFVVVDDIAQGIDYILKANA